MDGFNNVQNCDSYINIPSSTFGSVYMLLFTDMPFVPEVRQIEGALWNFAYYIIEFNGALF
jgi:hypothetical protein